MPRLYGLLIITILCLYSCHSIKPGVVSQDKFKTESGWQIPYNIFYPDQYEKNSDKYPLLLVLHGSGERGDENKRQLIHLAPYLLSDSIKSLYQAVLVFPQCPKDEYWAPVNRFEWTLRDGGEVTMPMKGVIQLMENLLKNPRIDKDRVYVMGLSMGGFGTLDIISRKPEWFAGAVPICGGADLNKVDIIKSVPIWAFHGAQDETVTPQLSRDLFRAMQERGVSMRYTEYPEGKHNVWNDAIKEPDLLAWLFSQTKK